jgi:3-dehydroquinate synthetase/shikimate kinase
MEVVLVGLSGSGKTSIARALAQRHGAELVDLDDSVGLTAGSSVADIFAREGETGFREREAVAIAALGAPDTSPRIRRIIATGGGAVVAPRNRWRLYRGRRVVWLDADPGMLLPRLRDGEERPLLAGPDPLAALKALGRERERFYAAGQRVDADGEPERVLERVEAALRARAPAGTPLLATQTAIGRMELSAGSGASAVADALGRLEARRAVVVSEPVAWRLHGPWLRDVLLAAGRPVDHVLVPRGERAKMIRAWERLVRDLAARRLERGDPIVALGGGALGDAAGFAAATYLRGVPLVQVPTTMLAQIDSAIGGKTGLDLPEGKNLVGAFHQPAAIVLDVALLGTLPSRERRAALGEAVKYALLGDEPLMALLERDGAVLAERGSDALESGALAEMVERCAWAKVQVVLADEREAAGRIVLNLGHSIGHAVEAAAGYRGIAHGEAVAHGLRGALAIGDAVGVTPRGVRARAEALLDALGLATEPPPVDHDRVRGHLGADKKHAGGVLRWVLVGENGPVVRSDVPDAVVERGLEAALRGRPVVAR